ncbi:MAG: hypothetical protein K8R36_25205 [Planctomycetales bacterium]|nr:hypothetical protein [Planctomycetales bacterium]
MRYSLRSLMIVVAVIATSLGIWRVVASHIKTKRIYAIRIAVADMPVDDDAAIEWVRAQPGVWRAAIGRKPDRVEVIVIMDRDLNGNPPVPNVREAFERMKYKGIGDFEYVGDQP